MAMMNEKKAVACLVRMSGTKATTRVDYQGTSNRYLNLDAVRISANDEVTPTAESFAKQLGDPAVTDDKVLPADTRPWKAADPLALLQGALTAEDLRSAFSLDPIRVPELRFGLQQASVVGLNASPWGPVWVAPLPPVGPLLARKLVDPKAETDTARGVYNSLEEALTKPKSGDVIEIRASETLHLRPLPILRSGVTVTIRPERGSQPILDLDRDTHDRQAALFRVDGGQLNLEELEFRLAPDPMATGFDSQGVALVFGDGSVHFTNCRITLDGQADGLGVPLAGVTLADPTKGVMMQPGATGMPKIAFDSCFIRGQGDLVSARASRPFDLDVKDSLAALTGSLLDVEAGTKEAPAPSGKEIQLRLNQVTAYLGGHLVRLRAANVNSLVPVHCNAVKCLFVSASDHRKALLLVEAGPAESTEPTRARMPWQADGNNYANFSHMLDQQAGTKGDPQRAENDKWKENDTGSKVVDDVKFVGNLWPSGDVVPAAASPGDFEVKSGPKEIKEIGLRKVLPPPAGDR